MEKTNEIILLNENGELTESFSKEWDKLQKKIATLQEQEKQLKELILKEMETMGIARLENVESGLVIDYYPENIANKFDSTRFKKENPDIYESYLKATTTKSFIKIWERKGK
jgi:predicted phage-related endonuclease